MFREFLPSLRKQSLVTKRPASIADMMEEFWREPFGSFPAFPFLRDQGYPALDISEADSQVVVKAELPGLDPKDVEITVDDDTLSIKGEKRFEEEERKDNYHRIERSYGSFQRTVLLPCAVKSEDVKARFDKGVLTITMAKSEKEKGRKVMIES